jgi:lincosamide nucleotidyltransferase A/C/D/E
MCASDVHAVLDVLQRAGITVWIEGGWGVDALLGEETRAHNDLDIVIEHTDVERYMDAMRAQGFGVVWRGYATPRNFVMADAAGREVDVHLVDRNVVVRDAHDVEIYGPNGLEYEVGSLDATGEIGGRNVACCTAAFQVRTHTGYEHDADDARDVLALCARFGIPVPAQYERE